MKKYPILLVLLCINILGLYYYFQLRNSNEELNNEVKTFPIFQQKLETLNKKNTFLYFPWSTQSIDESKTFLEKQLLELPIFELKDHYLTPSNEKFIQKFKRPRNNIYDGYLSGFILHKDCITLLEKLSQIRLPIWIDSITLQRDFYHSLGLQVSFTYTLAEMAH